MRKLTEADIIRMMREEWDAKVQQLSEAVDATLGAKVDGEETTIMDPSLKLRHKKSQLLYTVVSVSPRDVILRAFDMPDAAGGKPKSVDFLVDKGDLEQNYELS